MKVYNPKEIEAKWQKRWENEEAFKAVDFHPTKPKYYVLYEFYNISGNLHMGHLKGTVPSDALARYKRLCGYNVLFPIGGDAFGLPAENAAIKTGIAPQTFVENGMKAILDQSKKVGLSFDWSRTICTSDPEYYKWTQWIFMQFLKHNKAYKKDGTVNFCPKCQTVLSNEDSQGGKCDRCGSEVIQVSRPVWFLKMQEYAEKLLQNVDRIEMDESLKEAQRNWIGKSEGVNINFKIYSDDGAFIDTLSTFTTCIETIYGVTYIALAPEAELIDKLKPYIKNFDEILAYRKETAKRTLLDRKADQKSKTGCPLNGVYAKNLLSGEKVKLFVADYVIAGYGTGAVMAVPPHDQRDFEFAKKFGLPSKQVIEGDVSENAIEKKEYMAKNSKMINSAEFTGMPVKEAKVAITNKIVREKLGEKVVNYNMGDWPFNRQRYWGEPFPVVFCDKCGAISLEEKDLPLTLPKVVDYLPNKNGDSPLSKAKDWVECKCPRCGKTARRETDTMPNWAGSSWYWLRYCDPHNKEALADFEKLKYWGSVDCYTGGREHITRHVIYAFFWQNFLYEIGAVPTRDPFKRKMGSGLVLDSEGKKMSKSSKNGISPLQIIDKYGADVARMHLHFLSGYEDSCQWTEKGIEGITGFLNKVWSLAEMIKGEAVSKEHEVEINQLIKKVGEDLENLKLNTAIAALMTFLKKVRDDKFISREEYRIFLILLNPIAPHITSELYEMVFGGNIAHETWPKFDDNKLAKSLVEIPVQVNSKVKKRIVVKTGASQSEVVEEVKKQTDIDVSSAKKVIFVPNRIINFII